MHPTKGQVVPVAAQRLPPALIPLAGLLTLYLVAPLVAGALQAGAADWQGADAAGIVSASVVSVASATVATALVALGGIPLAYLLARVPGRRMALLGFAVQLPLALPPLTSGVLLLFLVGYATPLGRLTGGALTDSFTGIVIAEVFVAAPFLLVAARSAFAAVDPLLEDVATTLGHSRAGVFLRVSLPLAWRAILAGLLLTWLRAFGEFGATVMVAYHPYSLPVFTYVAFSGQGLSTMLPILLPTVLAAGGVLAASLFLPTGAKPAARSSDAAPIEPPARRPTPSALQRPLSLAFRRPLDGFTLDIAWATEARRLAILGASGSGKSATLRQIAGLDPAASASLLLDGRDLARLPPEARGIAYVPQSYGLMPHLSVAEQLRFAVGHDALRAAHWTRRLGLAGLEHRRPHELSLGQQQRVALGRALCRPSPLLLLDEPFSALDTPLRLRLQQELWALQREIDATTIIVTHDPAEALLLADELLLLQDGRVLQSGTAEAVFSRPVSEAVARLLGAQWVGHGRVVAPDRIDIGGVILAVGGVALSPGRVGWTAPRERIRIVAAGGYPATLLAVGRVLGGVRALTLQVGDATLIAAGEPGGLLQLGPCRIAVDPQSLQVWPVAGCVPAAFA